MNDCIRLGRLHGTSNRYRIEPIRNERLAAELSDEMSSFLPPRCAHDLMPGGHQSWKKISADGAGGAGYEDPHALVLRKAVAPQVALKLAEGSAA
jgi:hypothetical protein